MHTLGTTTRCDPHSSPSHRSFSRGVILSPLTVSDSAPVTDRGWVLLISRVVTVSEDSFFPTLFLVVCLHLNKKRRTPSRVMISPPLSIPRFLRCSKDKKQCVPLYLGNRWSFGSDFLRHGSPWKDLCVYLRTDVEAPHTLVEVSDTI